MARDTVPVRLAMVAAAGASTDAGGAAITYDVAFAARVKHVRITLPPGSAGTLQLRVEVLWQDNWQSVVAWAKGGHQFISGDDVILSFDCDWPSPQGSNLRVWYNNTDAVNAHEFFADVILQGVA